MANPALPLVRQDGATGDPGWLPLVLILGAIGVVAYADHHMVSFTLIFLYVLPLGFAAIFLRKEIAFGLILVCIVIHYFDSPRRISLELRLFHDVLAMVCFVFVVYVIQRYVAQREALVQTIAEQRDGMLKDLKLGEQVQRLFLPAASPVIAGLEIAGIMQPARWLSGDYYSYIPINGEKLEIVIADVAGKGVAASLLMSATAAAMHIGTCGERSIREGVNRLNAEIQSVSDGERYVTLLMTEIDTVKRKLRYINCGHNPGLWVRGSGKLITRMEASCAPIGLMECEIGELACESLEDGDVIVLYTDGVTEAMNVRGEEFGMARLEKVVERDCGLSAQELISSIMGSALKFTEGVGFGDDVTVVVVKCKFDRVTTLDEGDGSSFRPLP